jgi:transglutaminase/protease-like cytokinesis protein 3
MIREAYYTVNYDVSNLKQINVSSFPLGDQMVDGTGKLSPDGKTLFFIGNTPNGSYLYSINTDGTNLKQVIGSSTNPSVFDYVDGAY